jgi:hypothetical protein
MKRLFLLVFLAGLLNMLIPNGLSGADGGAETIVGVLSYVPAPDVSICFCGCFHLSADASFEECYLVSGSIDLSEFVGQRVLVSGRPFSALCSGTLARACSYFEARKIVVLARAGVTDADWGAVKMIYR